MEGCTEEPTDEQTLFYQTLPADAMGPISFQVSMKQEVKSLVSKGQVDATINTAYNNSKKNQK